MLWTPLNSSKFPKSDSSFCLDSHLLRMWCFFIWWVPPMNMRTLCFIYIFQGSTAVKLETNLTASLLKKHAFKETYFKGCSPKNTLVPQKSAATFSGFVSIEACKKWCRNGVFCVESREIIWDWQECRNSSCFNSYYRDSSTKKIAGKLIYHSQKFAREGDVCLQDLQVQGS